MKNIKKYYPLIVGLVLLISVAAYGTRAYFSDSTKEDAGIDLILGDVDITTDTTQNWMYVPIGEKNGNLKNNENEIGTSNELGDKVLLTDARPGDSFSKKFTFTNTGSLLQLVTFETTKNAPSIFKVKWENVDATSEFNESTPITLAPTKTVTLKMTVSVELDTKEELHNKSANTNDTKSNLNKLIEQSITVTAVQTNK